jgi:hypothetical protein
LEGLETGSVGIVYTYLGYFTARRYIFDLLVYFIIVWYIFSRYGKL